MIILSNVADEARLPDVTSILPVRLSVDSLLGLTRRARGPVLSGVPLALYFGQQS